MCPRVRATCLHDREWVKSLSSISFPKGVLRTDKVSEKQARSRWLCLDSDSILNRDIKTVALKPINIMKHCQAQEAVIQVISHFAEIMDSGLTPHGPYCCWGTGLVL
jgi:hypothetical protein